MFIIAIKLKFPFLFYRGAISIVLETASLLILICVLLFFLYYLSQRKRLYSMGNDMCLTGLEVAERLTNNAILSGVEIYQGNLIRGTKVDSDSVTVSREVLDTRTIGASSEMIFSMAYLIERYHSGNIFQMEHYSRIKGILMRLSLTIIVLGMILLLFTGITILFVIGSILIICSAAFTLTAIPFMKRVCNQAFTLTRSYGLCTAEELPEYKKAYNLYATRNMLFSF